MSIFTNRLIQLDDRLYRLESIAALISGITVFLLMCMAVISVSSRHLFDQSLPGYVDWIEQFMPLIAFLGMAFCQRVGAHIRMDIILRMMGPRGLLAAELTTTILMLLIGIILMLGSYFHFERSFDVTMPLWSRDSSVDIRLPLWPAKLLVPLAFLLFNLRITLQIVIFINALYRSFSEMDYEYPPLAGAPSLQKIEEIAKEEVAGLH